MEKVQCIRRRNSFRTESHIDKFSIHRDIGGGWGSFLEYAGSQGVEVTSLTISAASETFMNGIIQRGNLPCRAIRQHFLEYSLDTWTVANNIGDFV